MVDLGQVLLGQKVTGPVGGTIISQTTAWIEIWFAAVESPKTPLHVVDLGQFLLGQKVTGHFVIIRLWYNYLTNYCTDGDGVCLLGSTTLLLNEVDLGQFFWVKRSRDSVILLTTDGRRESSGDSSIATALL